jgi:hypothetical protein
LRRANGERPGEEQHERHEHLWQECVIDRQIGSPDQRPRTVVTLSSSSCFVGRPVPLPHDEPHHGVERVSPRPEAHAGTGDGVLGQTRQRSCPTVPLLRRDVSYEATRRGLFRASSLARMRRPRPSRKSSARTESSTGRIVLNRSGAPSPDRWRARAVPEANWPSQKHRAAR